MGEERKWKANRRALRRLQRRASRVFKGLAVAPATAREGFEYVLPFAASWLRYIEEGIGGVQRLHDAGLGHHAAPLRRSLVEHGVCMAALAEEPESFESFVRGLQRSTTKLKEALERIGIEDLQMDAVLAWETDQETVRYDRKLAFKHRCDDLGSTGARFYASWLEETLLSHAGYATAMLYLGEPPPGSDAPTLMLEPQAGQDDWGADAANADILILALDAFSTMMLGDPLRRDITRLNAKKLALFSEAASLSAR